MRIEADSNKQKLLDLNLNDIATMNQSPSKPVHLSDSVQRRITESGEESKLTAEHENLIRGQYNQLLNNLTSISEITAQMFQDGKLSANELERIEQFHSTPIKASEDLLNIIIRNSCDVYECFLRSLKKTNQYHVYQMLTNSVEPSDLSDAESEHKLTTVKEKANSCPETHGHRIFPNTPPKPERQLPLISAQPKPLPLPEAQPNSSQFEPVAVNHRKTIQHNVNKGEVFNLETRFNKLQNELQTEVSTKIAVMCQKTSNDNIWKICVEKILQESDKLRRQSQNKATEENCEKLKREILQEKRKFVTVQNEIQQQKTGTEKQLRVLQEKVCHLETSLKSTGDENEKLSKRLQEGQLMIDKVNQQQEEAAAENKRLLSVQLNESIEKFRLSDAKIHNLHQIVKELENKVGKYMELEQKHYREKCEIKEKNEALTIEIYSTKQRLQELKDNAKCYEIKLKGCDSRLGETEKKFEGTELRLRETEKKLEETESRVRETEKKLEKTESRVRETEKKFEGTELRLRETEKKLEKTESRVRETEKKLKETESRLRGTEKKFEGTELRLRETEKKLEETESRVRETEKKFEGTELRLRKTEKKLEETETRVRETEKKLEKTESRLRGTENKFEETESRVRETEKKFEGTELRLRGTEKKLEKAESRVRETEKKLEKTESRLREAEKKLEKTESRLRETEKKLEETEINPTLSLRETEEKLTATETKLQVAEAKLTETQTSTEEFRAEDCRANNLDLEQRQKRERKARIEEKEKLIKQIQESQYPVELQDKYTSDPVLVQTIRTKAAEKNKSIRGVTILEKELFVVSYKSSEVEVYDSMELRFSRLWKFKKLIDPRDIESCNINKCLYIIDFKGSAQSKEILRVDPNGKLIKSWSTGNDWGWGLSVTDDSNVILTVLNKNKLNEYSPDGQLIREINLVTHSGIHHPWHTIKLTNGHFLVSHGWSGDDLHRVCVVDGDGELKKSSGGKLGSNIGQMNHPHYLAVDRNGFVIVADLENSRVLLLNSDLEFSKEILSKEKHGLGEIPMILHQTNNRLFVVDNEWNGEKTICKNSRILIFKFR